MNKPINVALYGQNGHQIQRMLLNHPHARLAATAAITTETLAKAGHDPAAIHKVDTLEQLLQLKDVDVVSLCSPMRSEQTQHAIQCLQAGKHVYAEKPCALSESELDAILAAAKSSGRVFHEMAGTVLSSRYYLAVRQAVLEGRIGTVVQVNAEKSYPWSENRPKDETTDGGLIRWVAVHAFRMVEHTTGLPISQVQTLEASIGNPRYPQGGGEPVSAVMMLTLSGGAVASVTANYLNPRGTGMHGYESVRIFGTKGMVESTHDGRHNMIYIGQEPGVELALAGSARDYFNHMLDEVRGVGAMPIGLEDELHPTRMVIRAKASAQRA